MRCLSYDFFPSFLLHIHRDAKDANALPALLRIQEYLHNHHLRVKDIFAYKAGFDSSGDGCVDIHEFSRALELLGLQLRERELQNMITFLDVSRDGKITTDEIEASLRELKQAKAILLRKKSRGIGKREGREMKHRVEKRWQKLFCSSSKTRKNDVERVRQLEWLRQFDKLVDSHVRKLSESV